MREESERDSKSQTFTSARSLLGMLRLSTALARIRMSNEVLESDVEEAARLMHESKAQLNDDEETDSSAVGNPITRIWEIFREQIADRDSITVRAARDRVSSKGYTEEEFQTFLTTYEDNGVFTLDDRKTRITMADRQ